MGRATKQVFTVNFTFLQSLKDNICCSALIQEIVFPSKEFFSLEVTNEQIPVISNITLIQHIVVFLPKKFFNVMVTLERILVVF